MMELILAFVGAFLGAFLGVLLARTKRQIPVVTHVKDVIEEQQQPENILSEPLTAPQVVVPEWLFGGDEE